MRSKQTLMLLAEDNPSDAELALAALAQDGLHDVVHHVHDGVEALDCLFGRGAHGDAAADAALRVVVLDVKLPKLDGLEVLREIRSNPRTRLLPVVMLTSSNVERDVLRGYELGANSYVQKPLDFDRFRETVRRIGRYWLATNEPRPVPAVREP